MAEYIEVIGKLDITPEAVLEAMSTESKLEVKEEVLDS